jgi:hypothetical protein
MSSNQLSQCLFFQCCDVAFLPAFASSLACLHSTIGATRTVPPVEGAHWSLSQLRRCQAHRFMTECELLRPCCERHIATRRGQTGAERSLLLDQGQACVSLPPPRSGLFSATCRIFPPYSGLCDQEVAEQVCKQSSWLCRVAFVIVNRCL